MATKRRPGSGSRSLAGSGTGTTTATDTVVGVSDHAGWAMLVTIADGAVVDRRRVELVDEGLSAFPHHHEGSWAIGRYTNSPWAKKTTLEEALALVERVRACAVRRAREALASLAESVSVPISGIALRALPDLPATVEARIRDNRAQTVADAVLYREALAGAATTRGWSVHWFDREDVLERWAAPIRVLGHKAGTPWNADHKLAAAAALHSSGPRKPSRDDAPHRKRHPRR